MRRRRRSPGYRIKNKNPHKVVGKKHVTWYSICSRKSTSYSILGPHFHTIYPLVI
jgi:hypothetical protein